MKYYYKINVKHFSKAEGKKVETFCVSLDSQDDISAKIKAARLARAFWKIADNQAVRCDILEIAEI